MSAINEINKIKQQNLFLKLLNKDLKPFPDELIIQYLIENTKKELNISNNDYLDNRIINDSLINELIKNKKVIENLEYQSYNYDDFLINKFNEIIKSVSYKKEYDLSFLYNYLNEKKFYEIDLFSLSKIYNFTTNDFCFANEKTLNLLCNKSLVDIFFLNNKNNLIDFLCATIFSKKNELITNYFENTLFDLNYLELQIKNIKNRYNKTTERYALLNKAIEILYIVKEKSVLNIEINEAQNYDKNIKNKI